MNYCFYCLLTCICINIQIYSSVNTMNYSYIKNKIGLILLVIKIIILILLIKDSVGVPLKIKPFLFLEKKNLRRIALKIKATVRRTKLEINNKICLIMIAMCLDLLESTSLPRVPIFIKSKQIITKIVWLVFTLILLGLSIHFIKMIYKC